jgi:hypothetical protein
MPLLLYNMNFRDVTAVKALLAVIALSAVIAKSAVIAVMHPGESSGIYLADLAHSSLQINIKFCIYSIQLLVLE